jgi:hypothetical protein
LYFFTHLLNFGALLRAQDCIDPGFHALLLHNQLGSDIRLSLREGPDLRLVKLTLWESAELIAPRLQFLDKWFHFCALFEPDGKHLFLLRVLLLLIINSLTGDWCKESVNFDKVM